MWRKRGLLLLAIVAILGAVAASYFYQRQKLVRQAPPPPKSLPREVEAVATDWVWSHTVGGKPVVEVRARSFRQVKDYLELEPLELRLYHQDGRKFDRVTSPRAEFGRQRDQLYAGGDVEITMGLPAAGPARGRLVLVRTSGVTFETQTGRASTTRPASFSFDQGEGQAVGASYDPSTRELHMTGGVELDWRGRSATSQPMKLAAGELIYKERDATVLLFPWSRLTRENMALEAADALVWLEDGSIRKAEAKRARGSDRLPKRQLEYGADQLTMLFSAEGEIEKLTAEGGARLAALSEAARTTVRADRVDLEFDLATGESVLKSALARGAGSMESVPLAPPGAALPETRLLRSEVIQLTMRTGGREIQAVETRAPGEVEFVPNRAAQRHRRVKAERMWITYGPENQIRSFRAVNVQTRTDPPPAQKGQPALPPVLTSSQDLAAEFEPKTGQVARLEQWNDFRYQEGERQGRAVHARLEEARHLITLEQAARLWDSTGSTSAYRIVLHQQSGEVSAEGDVLSSRLPERKGPSSALLSQDDPLEARAARMFSTDRNQKVRYEGGAVLWQGANRIRAERIEIDRRVRRLAAAGGVRTQFVDAPQEGPRAAKRQGPPPVVVVESAELLYTEEDRLARFGGGARLTRLALEVRGQEIRAYFKEANSDSALDRAYAEGRVEIVEREGDRQRKGTADHAEYYAADSRILLWGGAPTLIDSLRGHTRGDRLTYWADDDKLLVNGAERPVVSRLRRRP